MNNIRKKLLVLSVAAVAAACDTSEKPADDASQTQVTPTPESTPVTNVSPLVTAEPSVTPDVSTTPQMTPTSQVTPTVTAEVTPTPERAQFPQSVISYNNTDIGVGGVSETVQSTSESWQAPADRVLPYNPASEDPKDSAVSTTVTTRNRCENRTYTMEANPREIVLYDNDGNYSWPGAILQGESYRGGRLQKLSVAPEFRTPLTIVVSNLYTNSGNSAPTIEVPSFSAVDTAIKSVIEDAFASEIPTGSNTSINIEETKDLKTFFIKAGFSGKTNFGLGKVNAELGSSLDTSSDTQTLVIQLTQKLFDVTVEEPTNSESWFTDDFFTSELPSLIEQGEVSAANPPVYVSKVSYGRMVTATISSTATSSEIEATVKATYDALTKSGTVDLDSKMSAIYSNASKNLVALGGDSNAANAALESGDWGTFFSNGIDVTEAVPLTVSFKNLHDNSPAGTTEVSEHTETSCEPYLVVDGSYDFQLTQTHEVPEDMSGANHVETGLFNDDDILDIVWNSASGSSNDVYLTVGGSNGQFEQVENACVATNQSNTPVACDISQGKSDWSLFDLHVGDLNDDGHQDLVWTNSQQDELVVRVLRGGQNGFVLSTFSEASVAVPNLNRIIGLDENAPNGKDHLYVAQDYYRAESADDGYDNILPNGCFVNYMPVKRITPTFPGGELSLKRHHVMNIKLCMDDHSDQRLPMSFAEMSERTHLWLTDIDSDGRVDLLDNRSAVAVGNGGYSGAMQREKNQLAAWLNTANGPTKIEAGITGPDGNYFFNARGPFWLLSNAAVGAFTGVGQSMVRIDRNNGRARTVYWDHSGMQWIDTDREFDLFPWAQHEDVTDLSGLLTANEQLIALDINDDQFDDLTMILATGSGVQELWFATVNSAKQSGGPSLFDTSTVNFQQHPVVKNWSQVDNYFSGKFDGDNLDDIVLIETGSPGKIYVARAKANDM